MTQNLSQTPFWIQELVANRQKGFSLEQPFYINQEIFELDIRNVYMRHWLFAGHISRIPNPGDYFIYNVAGEAIIIIRGPDGHISALLNVCRHRGSRICSEESGRAKRLVCPYHAWVYDTDGALVSAGRMPDGFDKSQFGLYRCHVRVLEGIIFICLSQNEPDFEPLLRDVESFLKPHGLDRAKICYQTTHRINANWKLVAENFWECYHCPHTHPEFCSVMTYPQATLSQQAQEKQDAFVAKWEIFARSLGHKTGQVKSVDGSLARCQRVPIRPGYLTQSIDGQPVAPLMGNFKQYDGGVTGIQIYPILWFSLCNDHAMLSRFTPIAPIQTEVEYTWLVHEDAVEGIDCEVERVIWVWAKTGLQDWRICEENQLGVNSRFYRPGQYSRVEVDIERFIQWYLKQIA